MDEHNGLLISALFGLAPPSGDLRSSFRRWILFTGLSRTGKRAFLL